MPHPKITAPIAVMTDTTPNSKRKSKFHVFGIVVGGFSGVGVFSNINPKKFRLPIMRIIIPIIIRHFAITRSIAYYSISRSFLVNLMLAIMDTFSIRHVDNV